MDKVAIVKSTSYQEEAVFRSVTAAFNRIGFSVPRDKKVFIKPNIMAQNRPQQHTVTHYSVVGALCRFFTEKGCKVLIGDSIAFYQKHLTGKAFKTTRIEEAAKRYGAQLVAFEETPLVMVREGCTVFKELYLPGKLLEADLVVNACKLKTHLGGLRFSGAVKNLFGCLPGGFKQRAHSLTANDYELSDLFIDLVGIVAPQVSLMDAIIGLDGGPSGLGKPTPVGVILAAKNPAALDTVACRIIGYRPEEIAILIRCLERGLLADFDAVEVLGELPRLKFKKLIHGPIPKEKLKESVMITDTFVYPHVNNSRCDSCGSCLDFCPTGAITRLKDERFQVDLEKCIYCYYCLFHCPQNAVVERSSWKHKLIRSGRALLRI